MGSGKLSHPGVLQAGRGSGLKVSSEHADAAPACHLHLGVTGRAHSAQLCLRCAAQTHCSFSWASARYRQSSSPPNPPQPGMAPQERPPLWLPGRLPFAPAWHGRPLPTAALLKQLS